MSIMESLVNNSKESDKDLDVRQQTDCLDNDFEYQWYTNESNISETSLYEMN